MILSEPVLDGEGRYLVNSDLPGHPFRGNQYVVGSGVASSVDASDVREVDRVLKRGGIDWRKETTVETLDPKMVVPSEWNALGVNEKKASRMAATDLLDAPPIVVVRRDNGSLEVINGLHRNEAALRQGNKIRAVVVTEKLYEEAASGVMAPDVGLESWAQQKIKDCAIPLANAFDPSEARDAGGKWTEGTGGASGQSKPTAGAPGAETKAPGGLADPKTVHLAARWVHRYAWDKTLKSMPGIDAEHYLKQFVPDKPVTLYRFEHADHDESKRQMSSGLIVQSWTHDKAMAQSIADELPNHVVREKVFKPSEIYTDFSLFTPAMKSELKKQGGESEMSEVLVYHIPDTNYRTRTLKNDSTLSNAIVYEVPVTFDEALGFLKSKEMVPTGMSSAQMKQIGGGFFKRSFTSAGVTEAKELSFWFEGLKDIASGKGNTGELRVLFNKMFTGSPLNSRARQDLLVDTNLAIIRGFGRQVQETRPEVVQDFPAWELYRAFDRFMERGDPRYKEGSDGSYNWLERWQDALDEAGSEAEQQVFASTGRMMALVGSPVWQALGDGAGGYNDTLGNDFPPFAWRSGMQRRQVPRDECEAVGLIDPDEDAPVPAEPDVESGFVQPADVDTGLLGEVKDILDGVAKFDATKRGFVLV